VSVPTSLPEENIESTFVGPIRKVTITINKVAAGENRLVDFSPYGLVVNEVTIFPSENLENVSISLELLENLPSETPEVENSVAYAYLVISATAQENVIPRATVDFDVVRSWIDQNTIDENTVALHRYENNAWTRLKTTRRGDNTTHVLYSAQLRGLSIFAICGEVLHAVPASPSEEETTPTQPPGKGTTPIPTIAPLLPILVVAIVMILLAKIGIAKIAKRK
jgi:PGF-pre-PGF domain-containing protein